MSETRLERSVQRLEDSLGKFIADATERQTRILETVADMKSRLDSMQTVPQRLYQVEGIVAQQGATQRESKRWEEGTDKVVRQLQNDIIPDGRARMNAMERTVDRWQTVLTVMGRTLSWLGVGGLVGLAWIAFEYLKRHSVG